MENVSSVQMIVVAGVLLVLLTMLLILRIYRSKKVNRYRHAAIKYLDQLYTSYRSGEKLKALRELPVLMKFTALSAYSHDRVAALHGEPWLEFLGESAPSMNFQSETGRLLLTLASASPEFLHKLSREQVELLFKLIETWILRHIPATQLPPPKEPPLAEASLVSA